MTQENLESATTDIEIQDTTSIEVTPESKGANDELEKSIELPEKFKGKSVEEIVSSYQDLESRFGKQGQELGEYRRLADTYIKRELESPAPSKAVKETEEEINFLDEPEKAVDKVVDKRLEKTQRELADLRRQAMAHNLERSHPDYNDIVVDEDFQNWVGSSRYRLGLFQEANQNFDYEAADELFSTYKQLKGAKKVDEEVQAIEKEADTKERINKLKTETGSTGQATKKIFSRQEIVRLKATNPSRYQELAPVIRQAYEEGRVRD